jgi:hypothetical protein
MFVALKNWRERLLVQGGASGRGLLARADRSLSHGGAGSADLLNEFRAAALIPAGARSEAPPLAQLGAEFEGAEPLTAAENLSIMASVKQGAVRQKRRR